MRKLLTVILMFVTASLFAESFTEYRMGEIVKEGFMKVTIYKIETEGKTSRVEILEILNPSIENYRWLKEDEEEGDWENMLLNVKCFNPKVKQNVYVQGLPAFNGGTLEIDGEGITQVLIYEIIENFEYVK